MLRGVRIILASLVVLLLVGGPVAYVSYQRHHLRHFRAVRDDTLYRSGQMSLDGLRRVVHDFGIRTVITLRDSEQVGTPPPDEMEEAFCRERGLRHVRITPRVWSNSENGIPAEQGVRQFLAVMDQAENYPVLVHCFAGVHRTGTLCAIYRIEYENWTNAQAVAEMKHYGYDNLEKEHDVLRYVENYRPRRQTTAQKLTSDGSWVITKSEFGLNRWD